jgi:hypothetical protein
MSLFVAVGIAMGLASLGLGSVIVAAMRWRFWFAVNWYTRHRY